MEVERLEFLIFPSWCSTTCGQEVALLVVCWSLVSDALLGSNHCRRLELPNLTLVKSPSASKVPEGPASSFLVVEPGAELEGGSGIGAVGTGLK